MSDTAARPEPSPNRGSHLRRWLLAGVVLTLLASVLAVGLPIYRTHQAVREFEALGGFVFWDYDQSGWKPTGLRKLLGPRIGKWFAQVHMAGFDDVTPVRDMAPAFKRLRHFKNLRWLDLTFEPVEDADLSILRHFDNIEILALTHTSISDPGLDFVVDCPQLTELVLANTAVTDAGLRKLGTMHQLTNLTLDGTAVTDAGLDHLAKLPNLKHLSLSNTSVTEDGVQRLQVALPNLQVSDD
jgi:hypothetical protein